MTGVSIYIHFVTFLAYKHLHSIHGKGSQQRINGRHVGNGYNHVMVVTHVTGPTVINPEHGLGHLPLMGAIQVIGFD